MSFISPQHRKLLIAVAAASFGLGLAGCDGDKSTSTSTNGPGFNQVRGPVGNVDGSVVDQNGSPLAGVTVSVGGKSVVTDVNGRIFIEGVAVAGTNSGGNSSELSVTLRAPAGFAGATATVTPVAQLQCSATSASNPQCVFVDGFTASMGTVVLPALNSRVTGTLRDSSSGEPVPGALVELDFRAILPDQAVGNGVTVALDHPGIASATTAADGSFNFTGVAADSCFELSRTGHSLQSQATAGTDVGCPTSGPVSNGILVNTRREGANTSLAGSLLSTPFTNADLIPPYVNNVNGILVRGASPGVLASGIDGTGGIIVTFSEAIVTPLSASDIQVVSGSAPNEVILPFTLAASTNTSFTVALATALPPGTAFSIRVKSNEAVDAAGNTIADDSVAQNPNYVQLGFDSSGANLTLALQTFKPFEAAPDAVALSQVKTQQNGSIVAPVLSSTAFIDSLGGQTNQSVDDFGNFLGPIGSTFETDVEQLNEIANTTPGQVDPLFDLGRTVAGVNFLNQGVARFTVDLSAATTAPSTVGLALFRNGVAQPNATFYTVDTSTRTEAGILGDGFTVLNLTTSPVDSVFDVVVTGAEPGDEIHAISRNAAGQLGGESRLSLVDIVAPTTALSPLAAGLNSINANLVALNVSAGGAIGGGNQVKHLVVFPVTPQSLDTSDSSPGFANDNLKREIGSANSVYAGQGGSTGVVADGTSMSVFAPTNVKLGVSFTEALSPLIAAPTAPAPAVLSDFAVQNDLATEDGNRFSFVTFTVDNVLKLESSGRGANDANIIDFTGSVSDLAGNVATTGANARVLVRDALPPLMTQAYRTATGLTFQFHEAVRLQGQISLIDCGASIDLAASQTGIAAASRITQSADGRTITVPLSNPGFPANAGSCFPDDAATNYAEPVYDAISAATAGSALRHGRVSYETVPDRASGTVLGQQFGDNTWAAWQGVGPLFANLGMSAPTFAAADLIGPFVVTGINCGPLFANGAGAGTQFGCDIGFSQPVSAATAVDAANNPLNYFQLENSAGTAIAGTQVTNVGGRIGTASSSGEQCSFTAQTCNVIRVSFRTGPLATATGDRVNMVGDVNVFTSSLDNNLQVGKTALSAPPTIRTPFRAAGVGGVAP